MANAPRDSLRRDLVAAYAAAGARVLAWAAVSRLVFGGGVHVAEYALLSLIRSTLGILNYTGLGLAPALIHYLSHARSETGVAETRLASLRRLYGNALLLALGLGLVGIIVSCAYALLLPYLHRVPMGLLRPASMAALLIGVGLVVRIMSEAPSAWLQTSGHFTLDNTWVILTELMWILLTAAALHLGAGALPAAGLAFALSSLFLLLARRFSAAGDRELKGLRTAQPDRALCISMLAFGGMITLSQLADFLYAPVNCILINRLLAPDDLAAYTLAMQVDAAILLLAAGLSAALLPRAASLLSHGHGQAVLRLYWRLTGLLLAALLGAALAAWLLSPVWLPLWLKADLPAGRAILPWLLVHTVLGGSSATGRSILIAAGKVRALAISTIAAGLCNVLLAYLLVRYTSLGLRGIVLATIFVVTTRSLLWMPWYVRRSLQRAAGSSHETPERR